MQFPWNMGSVFIYIRSVYSYTFAKFNMLHVFVHNITWKLIQRHAHIGYGHAVTFE